MSLNDDSLISRVQESYRQLSVAAKSLNAGSDLLGKSIAELETALRKLNLGLSTFVPFSQWESPGGDLFSSEEIGYAKINGKWGIALRTIEGDNRLPDQESVESWPFNEAPRALRIQAVVKIPDLLEKLTKEATDATAKVAKRAEEVHVIAAALDGAVDVGQSPFTPPSVFNTSPPPDRTDAPINLPPGPPPLPQRLAPRVRRPVGPTPPTSVPPTSPPPGRTNTPTSVPTGPPPFLPRRLSVPLPKGTSKGEN